MWRVSRLSMKRIRSILDHRSRKGWVARVGRWRRGTGWGRRRGWFWLYACLWVSWLGDPCCQWYGRTVNLACYACCGDRSRRSAAGWCRSGLADGFAPRVVMVLCRQFNDQVWRSVEVLLFRVGLKTNCAAHLFVPLWLLSRRLSFSFRAKIQLSKICHVERSSRNESSILGSLSKWALSFGSPYPALEKFVVRWLGTIQMFVLCILENVDSEM